MPKSLAAPEPLRALYALKLAAIWDFAKAQPLSFWLVCAYAFFEYVRPQQIYPVLDVLPYSKVIVALGMLTLLMERKRWRFGWAETLLGVFSLIVVLSCFMAVWPAYAFAHVSDYLSWVVIFLLIVHSVDTEGRFLVFMSLFLLYSFKMSQSATRSWASDGFAFRGWGSAGAPGWFGNSGELGIQLCIFLALTLALLSGLAPRLSKMWRVILWIAIIIGGISIVSTSSRGAELAGAFVILWAVVKSRRRFRMMIAALVLGITVAAILPPEQLDRFRTVGDDPTSISRKQYWQEGLDIMAEYPVLGIGYSNWAPYHVVHYGFVALPHNIFIEAGAQLGYTGLVSLASLIICTLRYNADTRRVAMRRGDAGRFVHEMAHGLDAALVAFLVAGFFVTVLFYPFFWVNFGMTVALNRIAHAKGQQRASSAIHIPAAPVRRRRTSVYAATAHPASVAKS